MTEKRYMLDEGLIYDNGKEMEDVVDVLNEYAEENEQLKQKIKSIKELLIKNMDYVESFEKIEEILK